MTTWLILVLCFHNLFLYDLKTLGLWLQTITFTSTASFKSYTVLMRLSASFLHMTIQFATGLYSTL
jgi:hypothetical protein